jgi:hypothetical protein
MKIAKGFILRKVGTDNVVVPEGLDVIDFNKLVCLNNTAVYLWQKLSEMESFEMDDAVRLLTDHYEVSEDVARKDVESLISQWKEISVVVP